MPQLSEMCFNVGAVVGSRSGVGDGHPIVGPIGVVIDAHDGFDLDRLPPDAEPYATVLSLHPRFELDDREGTLTESETPTSSPLVDAHDVDSETSEREEPNIPVYADALLLIDALERHDPTDLEGMETPALVNLYTLLSDVQRNANDLRQDVRGILLDRLHHD